MLQNNTILYIFYILIYAFSIVLFWRLRLRVKRNLSFYNQIPNIQKYQKSIFYIGDYNTEFSKRRVKSLREGVFYLGGISIWCVILTIISAGLFLLKICSVENCIDFSYIGLLVAVLISMYLSMAYCGLFYFSRTSFITSVILCQTKLRRGEWLIRCMTHALIATIILMPFFLLSTENYIYITKEKICLNRYFSLHEEEYYFDQIQQLTIEKNCNKEGEIYGLGCYIDNQKRFDVLNSNYGEEIRKRIIEKIEMDNCIIVDNADLSEEEIKELIENNSDDANIYEWFLNEYYIDEIKSVE